MEVRKPRLVEEGTAREGRILARPRPRRRIRPRGGGRRREQEAARATPTCLASIQALDPEEEDADSSRHTSSPSLAPAAMLRPPRKGGAMREGGVAAPPSATRASIRPLPPAAREAAGSTDGISRAVGGSAAGISRLARWGREWGIGKRERSLAGG
jgi:hypothetical protein